MTASPLPVRVRRITLAVIALSALVGSAAAQHIGQLLELDAFRNLEPPISEFWAQHRLGKEAARAKHLAHAGAIESMRASRGVILLGLTVCCSLAFVAALRILRPAGTPREGARRLLAGTAVACAALRTMDGAQMSAVAGRAGAAWDKVMSGSDVPGGYPDGLEQWGLTAVTIGFTVLIAGAFLVVGSYFRSPSLRELVAAADRSNQA